MTEPKQTSTGSLRHCNGCERDLKAPEDVGWECECGVAVCHETRCFEEFFKILADGESTRCRACGLVV